MFSSIFFAKSYKFLQVLSETGKKLQKNLQILAKKFIKLQEYLESHTKKYFLEFFDNYFDFFKVLKNMDFYLFFSPENVKKSFFRIKTVVRAFVAFYS